MEIGSGRGALTLPLSRVAQRVIAVEIDTTLIANLRSQFDDRIELVRGDFLQTPLPSAPYKVFGNVPFSRTTDIVSKLVRAPNPPRDAWQVVQREAAHRFCGPPYVRESLWSLRLKPAWHVEIVDRLRRVDFDPPPSVESVLLAAPPRSAVAVRFGSTCVRATDRTRVLREHESEQSDGAVAKQDSAPSPRDGSALRP